MEIDTPSEEDIDLLSNYRLDLLSNLLNIQPANVQSQLQKLLSLCDANQKNILVSYLKEVRFRETRYYLDAIDLHAATMVPRLMMMKPGYLNGCECFSSAQAVPRPPDMALSIGMIDITIRTHSLRIEGAPMIPRGSVACVCTHVEQVPYYDLSSYFDPELVESFDKFVDFMNESIDAGLNYSVLTGDTRHKVDGRAYVKLGHPTFSDFLAPKCQYGLFIGGCHVEMGKRREFSPGVRCLALSRKLQMEEIFMRLSYLGRMFASIYMQIKPANDMILEQVYITHRGFMDFVDFTKCKIRRHQAFMKQCPGLVCVPRLEEVALLDNSFNISGSKDDIVYMKSKAQEYRLRERRESELTLEMVLNADKNKGHNIKNIYEQPSACEHDLALLVQEFLNRRDIKYNDKYRLLQD